MKTLRNGLLVTLVILYGLSNDVSAQGHGHKHEIKDREYASHHKYDSRWEYGHVHHGDRVHRHAHAHRAIRPQRIYQTPRYVYYRDYDVYFDSFRKVYITYSGRHWVVMKTLPIRMRGVDFARIKRYSVDFRDDNLHAYLEFRRPAYF